MKPRLFFSPILDISGMMLDNLAAKHVSVDMGINFGCCDGFVSQHTLYGTQVRASFQQVGSEGMTEGVRADIFGDTGFLRQLLYQVKNHDAGDTVSPAGKEYIIFKSFLYFTNITVEQPVFYFLDGTWGNRD